MPLLKEVPREVKRGLRIERKRVRRLWVKKNWKWFVPACVGAIVALVLVIIGVIALSRRRACYLVHIRPETVTEIRIGSGECNSKWLAMFDLSKYTNLKSVVIGDDSYMYVSELKLIGLSELESVEIGMSSFTKYKSTYQITADPNRHFYLKDCPKLKSLKMGRYSFSEYTVCEIENVDALEVIEVGIRVFNYASLELRSILIHSE